MIKTCSCCGKLFTLFGNYMYKTKKNGKVQYQCCYTCYRKEGGDTGLHNRSSKTINNER